MENVSQARSDRWSIQAQINRYPDGKIELTLFSVPLEVIEQLLGCQLEQFASSGGVNNTVHFFRRED